MGKLGLTKLSRYTYLYNIDTYIYIYIYIYVYMYPHTSIQLLLQYPPLCLHKRTLASGILALLTIEGRQARRYVTNRFLITESFWEGISL